MKFGGLVDVEIMNDVHVMYSCYNEQKTHITSCYIKGHIIRIT